MSSARAVTALEVAARIGDEGGQDGRCDTWGTGPTSVISAARYVHQSVDLEHRSCFTNGHILAIFARDDPLDFNLSREFPQNRDEHTNRPGRGRQRVASRCAGKPLPMRNEHVIVLSAGLAPEPRCSDTQPPQRDDQPCLRSQLSIAGNSARRL